MSNGKTSKKKYVDRLKALHQYLNDHPNIDVGGVVFESSYVKTVLNNITLKAALNERISASDKMLLKIMVSRF